MTNNKLDTTFGLSEERFNTNLNAFYTHGQILRLFNEHCPQFKRLIDNGERVKEVTFVDVNNGKGFTSNIYSTLVKFENTDEQFRVAIKMTTNQKLGETFTSTGEKDLVTLAHENECSFYEMFRDINDGFAPKCYYTDIGSNKRPGMIILDDLSGTCTTLGIFKSCTAEQFWNVARKVASFQAAAAFASKGLVFLPPRLSYQRVSYNDSSNLPSTDYQKFTLNVSQNMHCLEKRKNSTNNVLFERSADGSLLQSGNPFYDIVRFLAISIDAEIRREIEVDVVERFYSMLVEEYNKQSGGKIKPKLTLEQANELYDLTFLEQTAMLMTLVPFYKDVYKTEPPSILDAKLAKLALRTWLCVEDALKLVDKWQLDGFNDNVVD
ncbi:hypothetical protein M3Y97_00931000 [Aphelenchoides bicaudatus]|nr:hypothetical protein M3Y97_00931000 [Aphelenchoides bicaudatus]